MSSTQSVLLAVKKQVYEHCGLVLEGIAEDRLYKALERGAAQTHCKDLQEYKQLISRDKQAFEQLISQLTVNETYFFREPEQIQLLVDVLMPQVLAHKADSGPVRILSAGCSSGEEPYSLVMALQDVYGERTEQLFHIDAGDLDLRILAKARQGIYSEFSFRGVEPHWRERYFQATSNGYALNKEVRQHVHFYPLNLLATDLPKEIKNYDIIFFRNVSIYFDTETRHVIQRTFYELMNEQSILFLGSSEILGNDLGVFELVEQAGQYFFVKGDVYRPANSLAFSGAQPVRTEAESVARANDLLRKERLLPERSIDLAQLSQSVTERSSVTPLSAAAVQLPDVARIQQLMRFGELQRALHLLDHLIASGYQHYSAYVLKSWILLNSQQFQDAEHVLQQALNAEPWSIDSMLIKGLSCKWQNDLAQAQQWFKKVIYSCPECWPAHYYLADICRQQEQGALALKAYQTVMRILSDNPSASDCMQWIPLPLPVGDVVFLSKRHIDQLSREIPTTRTGY